MKFAVVSDIHGNAQALRLVLADAARQGVDGHLLAGDYCISAPWGNEVVEILRQLPDARIIRGNDEAHLDVPAGDDGQFEVSRWCLSTLTPENKAWLDALPETLAFNCEGVTIRMAHSSQSFLDKALSRTFRSSTLPGMFPEAPASREALLAAFRAFSEQEDFRSRIEALAPGVYIFGHNHIQTWGDFDGRVLVNPGSCGMPLDCGAFGAPYTLLTIEGGHVSVEERRVPYDAEELIALAKSTWQYASARVWSEIIFSEWRTVREKVFQFLKSCERYADSIGDARRPFAKDTWEAAYALWAQHAQEWHPELFISE